MQQTETPPSTERRHHGPVRVAAGAAASLVAILVTALAVLLAVTAPEDGKPDFAWGVAGFVALVAIATWILVLVLTRVRGWPLRVVTAVLVLLTAIGVYGGSRDPEWTVVAVVSVITLPAWVASVLWNRAGRARHARGRRDS